MGSTEVDFMPFSIFAPGNSKVSKGRAAYSPALVAPFGIPHPRRPHYKERPKGATHPHFGEKAKCSRLVVPGGKAQGIACLALRVTSFAVFHPPPSPSARSGRGGPRSPSGVSLPACGLGCRWPGISFRAKKAVKVLPSTKAPVLGHLSPAHPLPQSRLRFGSLRRICGPIRPRGAPRKGTGPGKKGVQCETLWL